MLKFGEVSVYSKTAQECVGSGRDQLPVWVTWHSRAHHQIHRQHPLSVSTKQQDIYIDSNSHPVSTTNNQQWQYHSPQATSTATRGINTSNYQYKLTQPLDTTTAAANRIKYQPPNSHHWIYQTPPATLATITTIYSLLPPFQRHGKRHCDPIARAGAFPYS